MAVEDEDVVAGCVAALAEDSYDVEELEVDEVGEDDEEGGEEDGKE